MYEIEVFVGNHCIINPEIFELWLKGFTDSDAARYLQSKTSLKAYGATLDDLRSDVVDHYRLFRALEDMLKTPPQLSHQLVYQFVPETVNMLIQKYYHFDPAVIREVFGRKLNARNRKDLDDISDELNIPLKSCRRQFDNVKRVFKTVEDMSGHLVDNIMSHFCLRKNLAKEYAAIVFIINNRFETGKKKLSYLTFTDFAVCANYMISNWSYSSEDCHNHEDMDVDMDRHFLLALREVKALTEKDFIEEQRGLMRRALQSVVRERVLNEMDGNFRSVSKTIINIAYGLNHSRESRDIFIDIYEKLIEQWVQWLWTKSEVSAFLNAFRETALQMDLVRSNVKLSKVWERYMVTFCHCVLQMFPR